MKRKVKSILAVSFSLAAAATLAVGLAACGEQEEPPAGNTHEHVFEWVDASFATCTQKGSKKQVCTVCGAEGETRETDLVAHTPGAAQQKGDKHSYTCTVCGTVIGEEEHTYEWQAVIPATHTSRGTEKEVCSVCGAEGETRATDPAHTPGEWQIEGDKHYRVCTGCNAVIDEAYHDYGVGKTCLACGAEDYHVEDPGYFIYEDAEDGDGVIINEYLGKDVENLRIPSILDGKKVVGIGYAVFRYHEELKSVYISDGIETLGTYSFADCTSLTSIRLPNTLKSIGVYVFRYVPIKELILPEGLEIIGGGAFWLSHIEKMVIPDSVTSLGSAAFAYCRQMKGVVLSDNITEIIGGPVNPLTLCYTFETCETLEWIVLGKNIRKIERNAFHACDALQRIYYNGTPEELKAIEMDCGTLGNTTFFKTPIYYNDGTHDVGRWWYNVQGEIEYNEYAPTAYEYSHISLNGEWTLTSYSGTSARLTLPTEYCDLPVTIIGDKLFMDHTELRSVTIPDGYCFIGAYAFSKSGLTSIYIPDSVTDRNEDLPSSVKPTSYGYTFSGCKSLTKVTGMKGYTRFLGAMFEDCSVLTEVDIPDGLVTIARACFSRCTSLTSIVLPEGLRFMDYGAFGSCTSLRKVVLPDTLDFLAYDNNKLFDIFKNCTALNTIVLPKNMTVIPRGMFVSCSALENLVFPAEVKIWGTNPFTDASLKNVYYYGDEAGWQEILSATKGTTALPSATYNLLSAATVYYYSENYKANAWHFTSADHSTFAFWSEEEDPQSLFTFAETEGGYKVTAYKGNEDLVTIPSEYASKAVVALGDELFRGKSAVKGVILPDGITSIGKYAFSGTSIKRFHLPETVTSVGEGLFRECTELYMVTGGAGLKELPDEMFYGCPELIGFTIPESVTALGSDLFNGCVRFETFTVPAGVKGTLSRLFVNCTGLKIVEIAGSEAKLGAQNFSGCTALEWVAIPAVNKFESNTFEGWNPSAVLYYGGSETQWKAIDGLSNAPADTEVHYFSAEELEGSWHWNGAHTQPIFWGEGTSRHFSVTVSVTGATNVLTGTGNDLNEAANVLTEEAELNSEDYIVVRFELVINSVSSWPNIVIKSTIGGVETEYDYYYDATYLLITGRYYSPCGSYGLFTNDGGGGKLWMDPAGTEKGAKYIFSLYFGGDGILKMISID